MKKLSRYIFPRSLFGRFLLIIAVPMVLVQAVATFIFYDRHWSSVSRHMNEALAGDIAMIVSSLTNVSKEEQQSIIKLSNETMYLHTELLPNQQIRSTELHEFRPLQFLLSQKLSLPLAIAATDDEDQIIVDIQLSDGVLRISSSIKRIKNSSTYIFILWMTGTALLFIIISILFMRIQVRSISRLAEAAEGFGRGEERSYFKPEGAKEVRKAAVAFNKMKERILRQVTQRTEMLAGVSHDLRTPLTRLRLQLAIMDNEKITKEMEYDIIEMEKLIQEYLDFARGDGEEETEVVDASELLKDIIEKYQQHHPNLEASIDDGMQLNGRPSGIRRAINNFIDNGLRYGQHVKLKAFHDKRYIRITIEDDGPGIPDNKHKEVFKPFFRLDSSRNLDEGGAGLGMAIARDIIMGHGGRVVLSDSPLGGLQVSIRLPK